VDIKLNILTIFLSCELYAVREMNVGHCTSSIDLEPGLENIIL